MRLWLGIACLLTLLTGGPLAAQGTATNDRDPAQGVVWDLTPLFANDAAWERERKEIEAALAGLAGLKGRLGADAKSLASALDRISALRQRLMTLTEYAVLKAEEDARVEENQARRQAITALWARFEEATAFVTPEILALDREKIEAFEKQNPALRRHQRPLELILRKQAHTLTPEAEAVLAAAGPLLEQPEAIHNMLTRADMPWPTMEAGGRQVRLDPMSVMGLMSQPDRELRRKAFEGLTSTVSAYERTLGAIYAAELAGASFEAKARHYPSALAMALADDAMPEEPFRIMLAETAKAVPAIQRYVRARQRMMHLDEMHLYDIAPALSGDPRVYRLDEAEELILKALAPLGEEYVKTLAEGFRGHWMHAVPQPGKAPGASTMGVAYGVPPYVLVSFTGNYLSVSMVAHEWGHAMHDRLAQAAQPFETCQYSIFVADTPSVTNELLLSDYLIAQAKTRAERITALSQAISLLTGSYFRGAQQAELTLEAHAASDRGEPITGKRLSGMYCAMLRRLYGDTVKVDDAACSQWATSPVLYAGFYLYKYMIATSAAAYFAEGLERNDAALRARYFELLKAGRSDDPYVLLKRAGFDAASPAAYQPMVQRLSRLVDQLDAVLAQPE